MCCRCGRAEGVRVSGGMTTRACSTRTPLCVLPSGATERGLWKLLQQQRQQQGHQCGCTTTFVTEHAPWRCILRYLESSHALGPVVETKSTHDLCARKLQWGESRKAATRELLGTCLASHPCLNSHPWLWCYIQTQVPIRGGFSLKPDTQFAQNLL